MSTSSKTVGSESPEESIYSAENDKCRKLYPERGGDKYTSTWFATLFKGEGRETIDKIRCERNVYKCALQGKLDY